MSAHNRFPHTRFFPAGLFLILAASLAAGLLMPSTAAAQRVTRLHQEAWDAVDRHAGELIALGDAIWHYAETALTEYRSSEELAVYLEGQGFHVERGVAGMPTAFVAEWGVGRPVVGILAEFDALPGLSYQVATEKTPLNEGEPGHGCGHNIFGAGSVGAAVAAKEVMEARGLEGTIRLFGCPAEETVVGKVYMARDGVFDGLDCCLDWHPGSGNAVGFSSSRALNNFTVEFFGQTAHGAGDPWNGRSALDAVELMNHAVNMLREHVPTTTRIHYVIADGGGAPNVVPGYAKVWYYVRDMERDGVEKTYAWVLKCAEAAALATETTHQVTLTTGVHSYLLNRPLSEMLDEILHEIGPVEWTEEEQVFARAIQNSLGRPEVGLATDIRDMPAEERPAGGGSTDVAEVSRLTPTGKINTSCWPIGSPGHSWPIVVCSGMRIGHKGMLMAARVLGAAAVELMVSPGIVDAARAEFERKTADNPYVSPLPPGQEPPVPPGPPPGF